jgi:hypothetical protein
LRKIIFIANLLVLIASCSIIRKTDTSEKRNEEKYQGKNVFQDTENKNLTKQNFFIQKAEIEFSSEEENHKLIASIKFVYPDQYLLSLRSKTGIEAARIFITDDTVLINDRINKKLYFGKPNSLENRYSVSADLLPVVFGDFIRSKQMEESNISCAGGIAECNYIISGRNIKYRIDCNKLKVVSVKQEGFLKSSFDKIEFGTFIKAANNLIPGVIRITFNKSVITVKIVKIEVPWSGNIEFIPGSRYDLIELL